MSKKIEHVESFTWIPGFDEIVFGYSYVESTHLYFHSLSFLNFFHLVQKNHKILRQK